LLLLKLKFFETQRSSPVQHGIPLFPLPSLRSCCQKIAKLINSKLIASSAVLSFANELSAPLVLKFPVRHNTVYSCLCFHFRLSHHVTMCSLSRGLVVQ